MIKIFAIAFITFVTVLLCSSLDSSTPRFKLLGTQQVESGSTAGHIEFWHDNATGQEVICFMRGAEYASCYLTGRNWK